MIRATVVFLLLAAGAVNASADSAAVLLRPGEILSGRFVQQLKRAGFTTSLDSTGSFILALDQGLVWRTEQPVTATIVITPTALMQWANGKEVQHIPAAKAPILGELYALLASSLSGDRTALTRVFALAEEDHDPNWRLVLQPLASNEILARQLQSVTVNGDRFIRSVVIERTNGDSQTTIFSEHSLSTAPLPEDVAGLLTEANR